MNRVLLDVGGEGAFDSCQAKYPSILKVGDEWWMWYSGRSDDCFTGSIGLAGSRDGLRWVKKNEGRPVFRHGAEGTFDATKADHPAVLRFGGKFHMWYTGGDDDSRYTIGYATSRDGVNWVRENGGEPVLTAGARGKFDDSMVLHPAVVRDADGRLHVWYNGVGPQRTFRVGHAVSIDGKRWTRRNGGEAVLEPGVVGVFREHYVYNVFIRLHGDTFHMWYSAWGENTADTGQQHSGIIHAVSRDGTSWRKDAAPTLVNGAKGAIDSYACFACCLVDRNDELWMYYSAGTGNRGNPYRVSLAKGRSPVGGGSP